MRTPHALFATAVTAAALAAAVVAPVPAAGAVAVPPPGTYYVQSTVTGFNAADTSGTVEQHRPRANEDRQQWALRPDGSEHLLENTDSPGACLGRVGDQARTVACASPEARWRVTALGADRYTLAAPGTGRHLTVAPKPAGATHPAPLTVTTGTGDLAAWYLTPVDARGGDMPPRERRRLDQVTFLTAHNAYANGVDGGFAPPFIDLFPNQSRGIQQQLADGVRGFMLDIHQTPDGAILCHNSCTLVRRPVALWVDLQRMVDFLRAHPEEFVTVFLEDYVDPGVLRAELARVQGLSDVLYRPDRTGVRENGWPTMGELTAAGHRLLIFTDHSKDADRSAGLTRDSFGVMYQREWTVENHWSMGPGIGTSDWSCYSRWHDANTLVPLTRTEPGFRPLFVMNHFRDAAVASTAATDNAKLADRARRFCQPAARAKPTYLAVDRYELGDSASAVAALNTYTYP
ncbi:phospholipase [Streptomyces sp. Vc74B-19]|uniref:PI-PLC domain-containing protein n=1 Tax=unclassified Streptomyces TaxID=2593676 RepID=UPI001BFC107C|nr:MULTISPECIES: PI-PLC domain-containing protein [unclassified Streptomyces]MBT3164227.1 phospholipase [Streptomyces sp. Vc74B-19]MDU0298951.1 PI-PLC domain-containing protein [Streptomyces sp. PAL114]